jgi:hypothetical protein
VVPAGSGITATAVPVGSNITTPCNSSGYSGNYTYSCNSSGELAVIAACPPPPCTGGDTTTYQISGEKIHVFTATSTTFKCPSAKTIRYLIVGAGGPTYSCGLSGGGGGGGVLSGTISVSANVDYTIQVGQRKSYNGWTNTNTSMAFGLTAFAGGVGNGDNGVSFYRDTTAIFGSGSGRRGSGGLSNYTPSQGNSGGNSSDAGRSGGGGGAGGAGQNYVSTSSKCGDGGIGIANNITGSDVYYGGGGGGGCLGTVPGGAGGSGGGGNGTTSNLRGADGTDGLGGGGGGSGAGAPCPNASTSTYGGSGIVIVRYTN